MKLDNISRILFFSMIFIPFTGFIYTMIFHLRKDITIIYTYIFFIFGVYYFLQKKSILIPGLAILMLIFAFYRFFWTIIIGSEKHILTQLYYYIHDFTIFFVFIIIYNTRFSDNFVNKSIFLIKVTVILACLASLVQVYNINFLRNPFYSVDESLLQNSGNQIIITYILRRSSIYGFAGMGSLGLSFIPLLAILIGYMKAKKQSFYWLFLLMGGVVSFLSNTRFIIICFFILTFILLASYKISVKGSLKYILYLAASGLIFFIILDKLGYDFTDWFEFRLLGEGAITETSRYKAIGNFIRFFPENPILGTGYLTYEIKEASQAIGSSHIHVGYLSHLVYYGIIGCFFLFGFWILLLRKLYKTARKTNYWGSFFGFLIFLVSFATMSQSSIFYYGLLFCLIFDKYYLDQYYMKENFKFALK